MPSTINENLIYSFIGKKIKEFRERAETFPEKITQERLANEIGVSRVSVANFENGKQAIYLSDLYKIADFLNVDIFEFLPSMDTVKLSSPEEKLDNATDLTTSEKEVIKNLIGSTKLGGDSER